MTDNGAAQGRRSAPRRVAQATGRFVFGDRRRIGLWLLPLFLITALLAAVVAGSLIVLVFNQRVARLEASTSQARGEVAAARDEVVAAVASAGAELEALIAGAREDLARTVPLTSTLEAGVYAVSAAGERGATEVGSAFVIFSDSRETFLATTVAVAPRPGAAVEVHLATGPVQAEVVNVDEAFGVAALRLGVGDLPSLAWRPVEEPLRVGAPVYAVGVAGLDAPTVAEGRIAAIAPAALVVTAPVNGYTSGGPLVDASGLVVGVTSLAYEPFGDVDGPDLYALPIRGLCVSLIRCTDADLGGRAPLAPAPEVAPAGVFRPGRPSPENASPAQPATQPAPPPPTAPAATESPTSPPTVPQPEATTPTPQPAAT